MILGLLMRSNSHPSTLLRAAFSQKRGEMRSGIWLSDRTSARLWEFRRGGILRLRRCFAFAKRPAAQDDRNANNVVLLTCRGNPVYISVLQIFLPPRTRRAPSCLRCDSCMPGLEWSVRLKSRLSILLIALFVVPTFACGADCSSGFYRQGRRQEKSGGCEELPRRIRRRTRRKRSQRKKRRKAG